MKEILAAKPSITSLEIGYVNDAVTNGWGKDCYKYLNKFEKKVRDYFDVKFAWPTSSCHGALHILLKSIGVGPGDEVIVPDITWASGSVFPISWMGASPVFVDVLEDSWCIDPSKIESSITSKTKAIIAVHLYGNLAEMNQLKEISQKNNLILIEDAAEALGSEYYNRKAGTIGDFGVFSFHGTKTLTTGEGGVIISNRDDLSEKISTIENQGRKPGAKYFWCDEIGLKYKMSNIQAALGLAQFERANNLVENKRKVFSWYKDILNDLKDISLNPEYDNTWNSYWQPTVMFGRSWGMTEEIRSHLISIMNSRGINIRPFFYPASSMPPYKSSPGKNNPFLNSVSYQIFYRGINLPSYYDMSFEDVGHVCKTLKHSLQFLRV